MQKISEKLFNAYCAKMMGWQVATGLIGINQDEYYLVGNDGRIGMSMGKIKNYDPYNDVDQLQKVVIAVNEATGQKLDIIMLLSDGALQGSRMFINKAILAERDKQEEDILDNQKIWDDTWDKYDKDPLAPITNFAYGLDYDSKEHPLFPEHSHFDDQCRKILMTHARNQPDGDEVSLPANYSPYFNANDLLEVMGIVLSYLPDDITFEIVGRKYADRPDMLEEIRTFVKTYGTDEWMMCEELQFNKMCETIVMGFNVFDCQPIDENFDPYNNIVDLAPILPIVARRVQEPFVLGEIMYDLPREDSYNMDIFDNMRHYVKRHGQELLDILEKNDNG